MGLFEAVLWMRARQWVGYSLALAGPLAAILFRFAMGSAFSGYPFMTFFPPILVAALAGGRLAGAVAALLCALLADYYLIEPHGFSLPWPAGWIGMGAFFTVSAMIIVLVDFAAESGARLKATTEALRALNDKLEERVAERTRELTMMTAQMRDEMTTKEIAEMQLRQMHKTQAVGQLTSGIAHDFNNMLSIVIGSLDVVRRRLAQGRTDISGLIDNAMDGAKRAATLTHQLLAFSRQQPLTPVVIDANALISQLGELLRRALGETVALECVLAGGLWRCSADPSQLESAILNLAVNARDAMPGGGRLTIETQNAYLDDVYADAHLEVPAGQYVLIAVTDTGTGMTPEVAGRAFDPFFTTKSEGQGTGLGLSQVYGFLKQSGGDIKIYSEMDHGTTVKVYFPRYVGDGAAQSDFSEPPEKQAPAGSPQEVILVVDDDEAVREIHVSMLRELNYTVRHAAGGPEAIALMREMGDIALLFTDVVMPTMSGRELAENARMLHPDIKVLYTTGYTPNAVVHNGVVDHGVDLLPKPFRHDQLARKIRAVLDRV
jgi:signal transduction histidine kinase/CheY-like chemotaxis protein